MRALQPGELLQLAHGGCLILVVVLRVCACARGKGCAATTLPTHGQGGALQLLLCECTVLSSSSQAPVQTDGSGLAAVDETQLTGSLAGAHAPLPTRELKPQAPTQTQTPKTALHTFTPPTRCTWSPQTRCTCPLALRRSSRSSRSSTRDPRYAAACRAVCLRVRGGCTLQLRGWDGAVECGSLML